MKIYIDDENLEFVKAYETAMDADNVNMQEIRALQRKLANILAVRVSIQRTKDEANAGLKVVE